MDVHPPMKLQEQMLNPWLPLLQCCRYEALGIEKREEIQNSAGDCTPYLRISTQCEQPKDILTPPASVDLFKSRTESISRGTQLGCTG